MQRQPARARRPAFALALVFALVAPAIGLQQQQQPSAPAVAAPAPAATPAPPADDEDEVVRITTNLVQVDAVVTDRDGNQVTDLRAEDFEVLENGRPQQITNFSYFATDGATATTTASAPATTPPARARTASPVRPAQLRPEQVRRAIALVVDDLRLSAESINATRNALRRYVDEQMQPGDMVAIIRTSVGLGALQQFTSDRQQLHAAIDRVRTIARSGTRLGAFTTINILDRLESQVGETVLDGRGAPLESGAEPRRDGANSEVAQLPTDIAARSRDGADSLNEFRDSLLTVGTFGALNFVVRGLRELPGRKAVVLFSDGISIFDTSSQNRNERVLSALRRLVDAANRASVVFYAIDTRGLQPTGFTAADNTAGGPAPPGDSGPGSTIGGISTIRPDQAGSQVFGARSNDLFEGQSGLSYLTRETGGIALYNNNDFNRSIRRALDDMSGYYLLGYRPDESAFDAATGRRRFNSLTIRVKSRPNLRVRTRSGFLGIAEDQARRARRSRAEQLMAALLSPFAAAGLNLQLTSFFLNEPNTGSYVRSVLLMDAQHLTFTQQADGQYQTVLDIIGVTLGESGQIVDQVNLIETIRARPEALERFRREGMIYGLNVPVRQPGAYQLRVAVRDAASGRVGSASQYVEVPEMRQNRLTLSSLVISGNNPAAMAQRAAGGSLLSSALSALAPARRTAARVVPGGEGMLGTEDPQAGPAARRFRQGMFLDYACVIYNARRDRSARRPQLTTQVKLFRAGQEVFAGALLPVEAGEQTDMSRLVVARRLQLGTILEPGEYVLQLTVTDALASGNQRTATRWLDFEIVN